MLKEALALGAIAQDVLRPQKVKDLEAFFAQYPAAMALVVQALQGGPLPPLVPGVRTFQAITTLPTEVFSEAPSLGPEQGAEPNLIGPERPL